jgi:hypothetical protein
MLNRAKLIESLVSQFEKRLSQLPDAKLQDIESGKLEINLTPSVGKESGRVISDHRLQSSSSTQTMK